MNSLRLVLPAMLRAPAPAAETAAKADTTKRTASRAVTEQVLPGLYLVKGSVNTAVFERNGRKLLIDPAN